LPSACCCCLQVSVPLIYTALVAAAATCIAGLLVLPTLARDQLQDVTADTLQQVGVAVSWCVSSWRPGQDAVH
jgi:hypothetical protein